MAYTCARLVSNDRDRGNGRATYEWSLLETLYSLTSYHAYIPVLKESRQSIQIQR